MRDKQGGKVIGSGGFGCVFKPALKCKDSNQRTDGISKMLLNKDAKDEWDEITKVKVIISKIPNNDKYFLIDNMNKCKPDKLNNEDKTNLQSCSSLSKSGINSFNINFKLDNVEIINMPDGGVDIRSIFEFTYIKFEIVNASLINLLVVFLCLSATAKIPHFGHPFPLKWLAGVCENKPCSLHIICT